MELRTDPVSVSWQWQPKTVTTDPPRLIPHTEWALGLSLTGSVPPLRGVAVVQSDDDLSWGLIPGELTTDTPMTVKFRPWSWSDSDVVTVYFGLRSASVTDADLKQDPRTVVAIELPPVITTGVVSRVCRVEGHDLSVSVLVLAGDDTEVRRDRRWRVRPDRQAALPDFLADLTSGRQSGVVAR